MKPLEIQPVSLLWYVVYTQPKSEQQAVVNLENQGFETYCPQYKSLKKKGQSLIVVSEVMFPRYVFFKPSQIAQSIAGARSTRGVSFILKGGEGVPAVLRPEVLALVRQYEQQRQQEAFEATSPFRPGLKVRLRTGALQGIEALVHQVSSKRVTVLLELLGRPQAVSVDHSELELS